MKRYMLWIAGFFSACLLLFFATTVLLFSSGLERVKTETRERLDAVAHQIGAYIEIIDEHASQSANDWLGDIAAGAGCSRIVVTDSLGIVWWSSQEMIRRGDDISPYLVDNQLFIQCASTGSALLTPLTMVEKTAFRSLYVPLKLGDGRYIAIIEADQAYVAEAQTFRNTLGLFGAMLGGMLVVLFGFMFIIARKAETSLQAMRRSERMAFLGRTSAELAHEFKTPLSIIKSSADVLRTVKDPEKQLRAINFISEEVMRLSRHVNNILSFVRERSISKEPFRPSEIIASLSIRVPSGIDIDSDISPETVLIGDRDAFELIIDNLMRNAIVAMNEQGRIVISSEMNSGSRLSLLVRDTGPGITAALQNKLFEPFESGSITGTGLGLAIVSTLCERSGWRISLRTAVPACFEITIPGELWQIS